MHLYLGYKRYSSWSLRVWLTLRAHNIPFDETVLPFDHDDSLRELARRHDIPAAVPVLEHRGQMIWDSLAILETLAEHHPEQPLWPRDPGLRALARSACAEMHSGFDALRREHPMNCHRVCPMTPSAAVRRDLARLAQLWQHFERAETPAGDFLCGPFGIVDAVFAPVAWRARGYALEVSPAFARWSAALMRLPAMQQWIDEGAAEPWRYASTEAVGSQA